MRRSGQDQTRKWRVLMRLHHIQENIADQNLFLYLEQQVNDLETLLGGWANMSTVDPRYSPSGGAIFQVPYTELSRSECEVAEYAASPSLVAAVSTDKSLRYFWHPENSAASSRLQQCGSWAVGATSSTRTLLTTELESNFMIKPSLPKKHFWYDRTLKAETARYSVDVSHEFEIMDLPPEIAFFPEPLAIMHDGEGVVFREFKPRPWATDSRMAVPAFSLYSRDPGSPADPTLLEDIIRHNAPHDAVDYLLESIMYPIQDAWLHPANRKGLLIDLHPQNGSFEVNADGSLERLVLRDFQSVFTDRARRAELGLPQIWEKGFSSEQQAEQYTSSYDHFIGLRLFGRLLGSFSEVFPQYRQRYIEQKLAARFQERAGAVGSLMLPTLHRCVGSGGATKGSIGIVDTGEAPRFR